MKNLSAFLIISCLAVFLFSCGAAPRPVKPQMKLAQVTMAKGMNKASGTPIEPDTRVFSSEDLEAVAYVKFDDMHGKHKVRWEWYRPDNRLFHASDDYPVVIPEDKFYKKYSIWHRLPLRDSKSLSYPGLWQVKVYFDDDLYASERFSVEYGDELENVSAIASPDYKKWALVIGIENYANLPSVDFAGKDAKVVSEYFTKVLGVPGENVIRLIDGKATLASIKGNLKEYLPRNVDKDTILYVYFAGHGSPYIGADGKTDAYLIPYDGNTAFVVSSGYRRKDFYQDIASLDIKKAYVFLDSCFSGEAARGQKMLVQGMRAMSLSVEDDMLTKEDKLVAISASKGEQPSNAYAEKRHGLFTYFLLNGLKAAVQDANGNFSTKDLYNYVRDNVSIVSRRKGLDQMPSIYPPVQ